MDEPRPTTGAATHPWPVLGRAPRGLLILLRVAASLCAIAAVLGAVRLIVDAPSSDPAAWRWALGALGLLVTLASTVSVWTVLGRVPVTPRGGIVGRGPWRARHELRRDLLRGRPLEGDRHRLVAVEVAYGASLPQLVTIMGVLVGPSLLQRAADTSGPSFATDAFAVLTAVPAVILLVLVAIMVQWLRVRRAAAAIGALPAVEQDTRARASDGAAAG